MKIQYILYGIIGMHRTTEKWPEIPLKIGIEHEYWSKRKKILEMRQVPGLKCRIIIIRLVFLKFI